MQFLCIHSVRWRVVQEVRVRCVTGCLHSPVLVFLCSSMLPSVSYQQGLTMATVPQGCPTLAQVIHHGHGPSRTPPLGMERFLAQTHLPPHLLWLCPHLLTFLLMCLLPSWLPLFVKLVWAEVLYGPLTGWSFGAWWVVAISFRAGWKQLLGADRDACRQFCSPQLPEPAMSTQHSAQALAC